MGMHQIAKWDVLALAFRSEKLPDEPYGHTLTARFAGPEGAMREVHGYRTGPLTYAVRFCPEREGVWHWETQSPDAALCGEGSFLCVPQDSDAHGFLRVDAAHPEHFVFDDGTRHFMLGTTYYNLTRVARQDWEPCLDGCARYGINKVRLYVGATPGMQPALDYAALHWKTEAWQTNQGDLFTPRYTASWDMLDNLDAILYAMRQRGMQADLIMLAANARTLSRLDERHYAYLVDRYAAFSNVNWVLANEWNYHLPVDRSYFLIMGRLVSARDPYAQGAAGRRLLSVHQQTRIDFQFFDQAWVTHAIVQLGVRNGQQVVRDEWGEADSNRTKYPYGDDWGYASIAFNRGHRMPVVNDEFGYIGEPEDRSVPWPDGEPISLSREKHRRILWSIYMACGYASVGDKRLYPQIGRPYGCCRWVDCPEYEDIRRLADFFAPLPYWTFLPAMDRIAQGERVYCASGADGCLVAYAANGGTVRLTLEKRAHKAEIWHLSDGKVTEEMLAEGEGAFAFPPGADVAVRIEPIKDARPDGCERNICP